MIGLAFEQGSEGAGLLLTAMGHGILPNVSLIQVRASCSASRQ